MLCTREEKRLLLARIGVDILIEFPLNARTAATPPEQFARQILAGKMKTRFLAAGRDLSFGAGGAGDAALLEELGPSLGFETRNIDKVCLEGREVSSTLVREKVEAGEMEQVRRLLGMPYLVAGKVVRGKRLGRNLGFPTVNLLPDNALPYKDRIDLAIDHHPSQEFFAKETCLEADKAACGEIIWKICVELGTMDRDIATPLYVAVATDCGCFVYANTTPHTHKVAAALMEQGIPVQALNKRHFRTKSMARMKLESLILQNMRLYHGGTVAVAPVSLAMMAEVGATMEDTDDIAAFLGQIDGVLHTATIREHEGGECRISVRTDASKLNATRVCARLGGGGHKAASGGTVKGTVEDAERAILAAIDAQLAQPSQD